MTIAFDIDALTLVGSIDSDFLSFGFLASEVLKLFSEVPCTALIDITATSDIELSLISEDPAQSQECVALTEVSLFPRVRARISVVIVHMVSRSVI